MDNLPAADIIGASLGRNAADASAPHCPLASAADRHTNRLFDENVALEGLVTALTALRNSGRASHADALTHAHAIRRLEVEGHRRAAQIMLLQDERHDLITTVAERDADLKTANDKIAQLETTRDNLQAVRDAQNTGLKQQDEQLAALREELAHRTAERDAMRKGRAAAEAVIEDIRKRQAAARKASKSAAKKAA